MSDNPPGPKLSVFDATMIVMGAIIGVGIFFTPHHVARQSPNEFAFLGVWLLAGLITMTGAVTYADLGACLPYAGGIFTYLHDGLGKSFGSFCAYMFAWMTLFVTASGTIAILMTFASSTILNVLEITWGPLVADRVLALVLLFTLTGVAISGVKLSALVQNTLMVIKIGILLTLITAGLLMFASDSNPQPTINVSPINSFTWQTIPAALLPALFAYGGSYFLGNLANQVHNPSVNIPRAVLFGVLSVMILYLLINASYLRVLGLAVIAGDEEFCARVAGVSLGSIGVAFLSIGIVISTLGTSLVAIICIPWVYVAMAERKLFFQSFGRIHPGTNTPRTALMCQSVFVSGYILWGQAGKLIDSVVFVTALFEGLAAVGLLMLRRRRSDLPAPPIGWAYPICPILFLLSGLIVATGFFVQLQRDMLWTGAMVLFLVVGACIYFVWRKYSTTDSIVPE